MTQPQPEAPANPDGVVEEPPVSNDSSIPVGDPPGTIGEPTIEPPVGPDDAEAPISDPRVPGQPTRKQAD